MYLKRKAQSHNADHLWEAYQRDRTPELRQKLIETYLGLVVYAVERVAISLPRHVDKNDLVSDGFFGLLEAIERFDPKLGNKFETYAGPRIRGSIRDALREQDWLPTALRKKIKQYERTVSALENKLGRSADDDEIAAALRITKPELNELLNQLSVSTVLTLEEYMKQESADEEREALSAQLETEAVKTLLAKTIDKLPEKEKLVVSLYYYEGLTLKEISLVMKLSEARISQLHTKAIFRLRGSLSRLKSSLL